MSWKLKELDTEVSDFLADIGKAAEARVLRDLRRLAEDGHLYRGNTRSLGDGIFELKVAYSGKAYRLLYVHHDNTAAFLLCFEKKTQKTPKDKIILMKKRYASLIKQEVELGEIKLN